MRTSVAVADICKLSSFCLTNTSQGSHFDSVASLVFYAFLKQSKVRFGCKTLICYRRFLDGEYGTTLRVSC